ncbi:MAG: hypothetical protein JO022_03850, partial [Acidobacteriaceae bacterium]|nr:hypothetical protein [Acidobacteriaceae bacterium]
ETSLNEEQAEYAAASRQCAESLLQSMNAALEYAALSAGQVTLEESEFSVRDLFETILDTYSKQASAKGLRFIRDFDPDLPEIVAADAVRLKQITSSLIDNAIKFTNRGEVEVQVSSITLADGDMLLSISVRDTGIGIAAGKVQFIFDSFRQLDGGLAKRYGGMGLGLAVTKKLAELMHAELTVSSVEGQGSVFCVDIPMRAIRDQRIRPRTRKHTRRLEPAPAA